MDQIAIILPHQLFIDQPVIEKQRKIFLVEHPHFFTKFSFHKQKLIYHRATMKDYLERIKKSGFKAEYIECDDYAEFSKKIKKNPIHLVDPIEHDLKKEFDHFDTTYYESPQFLTPKKFSDEFFKESNHFSQQSFYIAQRKRMQILMSDGKPMGGKWSFDQENRLKMPKNQVVPPLDLKKPNALVKEALDYVLKKFPKNPGEADCFLPIDHEDSIAWLDDFLINRLELFGAYEDAIVPEESFLFHSVLSPMLNIGLLTPMQVVEKTLEFAKKHHTPLNSLEGFIRQIIGWREFMKITYDHVGKKMRDSNFFHHAYKIPKTFWTGTTKIIPIDITIKKILKTAYCHHIERLMVLGNFMLLSSFDPKEVYSWFMELFIDAYDWVMVPNVFSMSQYADGGLITTKPYVSSSNYLMKMSQYPKGAWCDTWDAIYWHFIDKHESKFKKNPRMTMMLSLWKKMPEEKKKAFLKTAKSYFETLN